MSEQNEQRVWDFATNPDLHVDLDANHNAPEIRDLPSVVATANPDLPVKPDMPVNVFEPPPASEAMPEDDYTFDDDDVDGTTQLMHRYMNEDDPGWSCDYVNLGILLGGAFFMGALEFFRHMYL